VVTARRAAAAAALAGTAALAGCSSGKPATPVAQPASSSVGVSSAPASVSASVTASTPPTAEKRWPFRVGGTPTGTPGTAAAAMPAATGTGYRLRLWFKGAPAGWSGNRLLVVYPAIDLSSDGTTTIAHAKFPLFWCAGRAGANSPNYRGCAGRRVEYADLGTPALTVSTGTDGARILTGSFVTYRYGTGVDRDPARKRTWTGRTWPVRLVVDPPSGRSGVLAGRATMTLGDTVTSTSAVPDGGYPNSEETR
jgi:hypothetical protein